MTRTHYITALMLTLAGLTFPAQAMPVMTVGLSGVAGIAAPQNKLLQPETNTVFDALQGSPFVGHNIAEAKKAASRFVSSSGLSNNFSLLLLDAMKKDDLVRAAIGSHGFPTVKSIVVEAIKQEREEYQAAWSDIVADTYSKHFSAEQLSSVAAEREKSPYFSEIVAAQDVIATEVTLKGAKLLSEAKLGVKARISAALNTRAEATTE